MTRTEYDKLVRDRIPEIIQAEGRTCATEVMQDDEYREALLQKLVEEAQEVAEAPTSKLVTELADLYEVVDALMAVHGIDAQAVRAEQERRRDERGAFRERIRLLWTE